MAVFTSESSVLASIDVQSGEFSHDMKHVAKQLRSSLASLMASAGIDPQDPQILSRHWGLNKTLSWKICKVIQTDDAYLALQQVPGREGMEILLKKGQAAGVEAKFVQATKEAVGQFENLIRSHCGDRQTFEMMGDNISPLGRQQRDEQHRKQFFQGASYVWGVQTRLSLNIRVVAPGAKTATSDLARVVGLIDFRRLRENVRWVMAKRLINHDDRTPFVLSDPEPIDPVSAGQLVPLMPEFCSQPTPVLNIISDATGAFAELVPDQIGNAGLISVLSGAIERGLPHFATAKDRFANLLAVSNTPAELILSDIFVHESFTYAIPPILQLRSLLNLPADLGLGRYHLPLSETLVELGSPTPPRITPEVPRYADVVRTIFDRTGWNPAEFRGFRVKMTYPPIPSALIMRYPLPEPAP